MEMSRDYGDISVNIFSLNCFVFVWPQVYLGSNLCVCILYICHKSHKYICGEKIVIIARGKSWISFLLKKVQCPFPLNGKFAFCVCGQRATRPSLTCSRLVMDPLLTFCSSLPNKVWNFGPMC